MSTSAGRSDVFRAGTSYTTHMNSLFWRHRGEGDATSGPALARVRRRNSLLATLSSPGRVGSVGHTPQRMGVRWLGNVAPYGYWYLPKRDGPPGWLIDGQMTVRQVRKRLNAGPWHRSMRDHAGLSPSCSTSLSIRGIRARRTHSTAIGSCHPRSRANHVGPEQHL